MDQAKPEQKRKGRMRPWERFSRRTLIVLGIIAVVLIAARLALPSVLRSAINARLEKIPDYTGWVERVGVSLWRGAYTLHGLTIQKRNGALKEPYFTAREIDFSVAWRELLHGRFLGDVALEVPVLTLVAAPSNEATQLTADRRWQDVINDIFPIDITWLKITEGQVHYINRAAKPQVDIRIAHLRALATGLRNHSTSDSGEFPATIVLAGETIGEGQLKISTQLEPLAIDPHFLLKLELEKVSLPALNEFMRAYAGVDVSKGTFSVYVEAAARDGRYEGYFKPFFDQVDFGEPPGKETRLSQEIWEWFVKTFAWIFKNHPRDEVATKIPFSGDIKNLDFHKWETFKNLVHHAFIEPFQQKLDSKAPGGVGAKDEKGLLPKAEEKK
jgi:hypothetical protein